MHAFFRAGKDATEDFEEIGHSRAAKEMLAQYYIGEYAVSWRHACSCSQACRASG